MVMWSLRAKDQVEGMKNEVVARIVEINMLLSLKRYGCCPPLHASIILTVACRQSEVLETDVGLVTSSIQIVQRPVDPTVSYGPSPAYHISSVSSTDFYDSTANDDISSSHHHGKSPISFFSHIP